MRLKTVHYTIDTKKLNADRNRKYQLHPEKPFTIVLVSDLHGASCGENYGELMERIDRLKPAAVLSAGDLITAKAKYFDIDHAITFVRAVSAKYPTYLVNGNHETRLKTRTDRYGGAWDRYQEAIAETSAIDVTDDASEIEIQGMRLKIWGYEEDLACYSRIRRAYPGAQNLEKALGKPSDNCYNILLAHHPDFFPVCAEWGADLTLAGHFHGGTFRVPLLGGVIGGSLIPFPKYDRGSFEIDGHRMIVGAGLGAHTIKLRINNPPELVALHFR